MIELADRQILGVPPARAAVIGVPQPAVGSPDHIFGVVRIDPDVVPVDVGAAASIREALAAILRDDVDIPHLVKTLVVFGIDNDAAEIEGPPHHPLAAVALLPTDAS